MLIDSTYFQIIGAAMVFACLQRWFCITVWGRTVFGAGLLGDASVHYNIIRHLKSGSKSRFIPNYIISPEPMSYPTLFHQYAKLYSSKTLFEKPWVPNLILYLFSVIVLSCLIAHQTDSSTMALVVGLTVFFFSPMNWLFYGPAISYLGLSERYFGRIWCSLAYCGVSIGVISDDNSLFILGTVSASMAFLSSIFARQALLFSMPLMSLLAVNLAPIICLVVAMIISVLIGRSQMIDGWRHTFLTWKLYKTNTKKSSIVKKAMLGFFSWEPRNGNFIKYIARNLMDKDPTRALFMYPELFFIVFIFLSSIAQIDFSLWLIICIPGILYLLTLTESFNHLGEAYRYIEYNLSFLLPLFIAKNYDTVFNSLVPLLGFVVFAFSYIAFRCIYSLAKSFHKKSPDKLSRFLENVDSAGSIVVFPVSMRLGADIVARLENSKSFWWQPGIISESIYDDYIEEYPFLKKDWKALAKRHQVTHIICSKGALAQLTTWCYDFSDQEKIAEDDEYIAYKVRL